jgi:hemerythrin-like domain-containing protein
MAKGSALKWSLIGSGIAAGAALIPLIPAIKRRAMRVTTILKKDHRIVSGMIAALEMTPTSATTVRQTLFDQIRNNFMVHAQAEEEILYPAMRNMMFTGGHSKVEESYHEHQEMKDLLNDMETMDPDSDAFVRKLERFKGKIQHHVDEEETEMFPLIEQRMSTDRQEELGRRIHDRKASLKMRLAA